MTRWQHAPTGNRRYWTRERIIDALRDFVAAHKELPTSDSAYNALKRGHDEWPPASRVLGEFGSMARGFIEAGAKGVSLQNIDWTPGEDEFLLENAGRMALKAIAKRLGRSYGSVRARLNRTHGKKARDIQCYRSAAQVASLYGIPYSRVQEFSRTGKMRAKKHLGRWMIDLRDVEKNAALRAAKSHSYKDTPPDVGDYYQRYGIRRRRNADGRVERYEVSA